MTSGPTGGQLILVATPIGNLGDLSGRAIDALQRAALICCEDTRRTGRLLQHAGVTGAKMAVTNEHTERERIGQVLDLLAAGADVALVSDAGTPGISDPGERLVRAAIDAGHVVSAVPGPAAVVMALVVSGMPTARFVFEGFLPRSGRERTDRLADVANEQRTIVLYEAPHRLLRTLTDLADACGPDRQVAICRELTKLHEEVWRGSLADAAEHVAAADPIGEHVLVLAGAAPRPPATPADIDAAVAAALQSGLSARDTAAEVSAALGVPKRVAYEAAVAHRTAAHP